MRAEAAPAPWFGSQGLRDGMQDTRGARSLAARKSMTTAFSKAFVLALVIPWVSAVSPANDSLEAPKARSDQQP